MHSIRFKITAVTIAAILTSILALGGIAIFTIGLKSDHDAVEKLSLISDNMQMRLNSYLNSVQQSVDMAIHMAEDSLDELDMMVLSTSPTPEQVTVLDSVLKRHCGEVEHAFKSIANNTAGIVTFYYCVNADLGSNEHGFFWSNIDEEEFVKQPDLISTDLDINDIEHTTWYYSPLKAGRPVWVGPYAAHYLGERLTVSYVAPIYKYGFLIGVLGMDILFETMVDQISSLKIYDTGSVFIMDKDGMILYHPEFPFGSKPDVDLINADPEIFRHRNSGNEMIRYIGNGQERQLAFSTLSNNMKVGVSAPVSEINATQREMSLLIFEVAFVILGLFTIFTMIIMDAVTKPLLKLTAASQKLMEGDYDVDINYEGKDEVGILTKAFSKMRDHLQLYISNLNSRAFTDALTGVKNKGAFEIFIGRLNDAIRLGDESRIPEFGFVIFDCNSLKQMNDENGHIRGDLYLQRACSLICRIYSHSPVFRLGGDEFSVLLQNEDYQNRDELIKIFDQVIEETNAEASLPWEKVSLAKGMAVFDPEKDHSAEEVLERADERMYEDKRSQKDIS